MNDFLKRFRALGYDHPWHMFPYYLGLFFLVISILDWSFHMLFDWELKSFLGQLAYSGTITLFVFILDRIREARSRRV